MKKLIKIFGLFTVTGLIMSCSDSPNNSDAENPDTTVEEDMSNIESSLDNTIELMGNLEDGSFSTAMKSFLGMSAGEITSEDWIEDVFTGMEDYIDIEATEDNRRFDFNAHRGVYSYNPNNDEWTQSSSNNITLQFPSSENSNSNDMTAILSNYADAQANVDGDSYFLPTQLLLEVEKSGERIFAFDLKNLVYSDNPDLPVPNIVDVEIFTAPFTHTLKYNKNSSTEFSFSFKVENDDLLTGIDLELKLGSDDYANLEEEDLENLSGSLMLTSNFTIDFDFEVGTLLTIDDPSENQINSLFNAEVKYKSFVIGQLEWSEENEDVMIIYKDGTSESASRYYEDFVERIETVFFAFSGDWVDF
tara:strand:- start:17924 stop:19006 length:1083 start_codon:yes stop_codon:yes gene_type:complete